MTTTVLPTFRRSAFRRLPRSLQAPWGPGMPGTHFVSRGDEYDVDIQDASPLTTNRGLWKIRNKLTPTTLTGKLAGAAALGGAAAAAPLALLGTLVGQLLRKQKV